MNTKVLDPSLADVLESFKKDIFRTMNCMKIGKIVSFNGTKKTARVQLLFKSVYPDGTLVSYPVLVDCPVFTLQGGLGAVEFPIAANDQCLVMFSDRNIDMWFQTGNENAPPNARCHDLADGVVLVGINALNSTLQNYVVNKSRIFYGTTEINLADTLVTVKNATATLGTLITNFIVALEGLQVNGPLPLTAASIATLEAQKLLFQGLLA